MKKNNIKTIPKFKSEDEERQFWATHDSTDYFDEKNEVFFDLSELKPTTKPITVRFPLSLINELKKLANKRDVPYQSLMKIWLAEKIQKENKLL